MITRATITADEPVQAPSYRQALQPRSLAAEQEG
jgi:hypothetical protein